MAPGKADELSTLLPEEPCTDLLASIEKCLAFASVTGPPDMEALMELVLSCGCPVEYASGVASSLSENPLGSLPSNLLRAMRLSSPSYPFSPEREDALEREQAVITDASQRRAPARHSAAARSRGDASTDTGFDEAAQALTLMAMGQ